MRSVRFGLLCNFLLITAPSWCQQPAPSTQSEGVQSPQVQKDAAASTILAQMAGATGWNSASLPSDVTAQATVTRYSGDTLDLQNAFGAIYKLRGLNQARIEYYENCLTSTAIVNGRADVILSPDS